MVKDGKSVIIVDAMAEVQCLEKDNTVENCGDLAKVFVQKLFGKYGSHKCNILYVVFDRYDIDNSLRVPRGRGDKEAEILQHTESAIV